MPALPPLLVYCLSPHPILQCEPQEHTGLVCDVFCRIPVLRVQKTFNKYSLNAGADPHNPVR